MLRKTTIYVSFCRSICKLDVAELNYIGGDLLSSHSWKILFRRLRLKNEQFIEPSPNRGEEPVAHSIQICHAKSREKILDRVSGRV